MRGAVAAISLRGDDGEARRLQADRLDRVAGVEQHEVGVAASVEPVTREPKIVAGAVVTLSKQPRMPSRPVSCATCSPMWATSSMSAWPERVPGVHHAVVAEGDGEAAAFSSGTRVMPRRFG
jgi:hypothetical protein